MSPDHRYSTNGLAMSVADRLTQETGIKHITAFDPRAWRPGERDPFPFLVRAEHG